MVYHVDNIKVKFLLNKFLSRRVVSMQQISRQLSATIAKHYRALSKSEESEVVRAAQEGDIAAKSRLIASQYLTVRMVARGFSYPNTTEDDIFMEGIKGIDKAIRKFDLSRNLRFITFATPCIKESIRAYIHTLDIIRHPTNTSQRIKAQMEDMMEGDQPTKNYRITMVSTNEPIKIGGLGLETIGDKLSNDEPDVLDIAVTNDRINQASRIMKCLNKRSTRIFQLLYGMPQIDPSTGNGWINPTTGLPTVDADSGLPLQEDPLTCQIIGDRLDYTRANISFIHKNCLKLLRREAMRVVSMRPEFSESMMEKIRQDQIKDEESMGPVSGGNGAINMNFGSSELDT